MYFIKSIRNNGHKIWGGRRQFDDRIIWLDLGYSQGSNFCFGGGLKDTLLLNRTGKRALVEVGHPWISNDNVLWLIQCCHLKTRVKLSLVHTCKKINV